MIKILFEHGKLFGDDSAYGIKTIAINQENKNYCDVVNSFAYLSKLTKEELDDLFKNLSYNISQVSEGTLYPKGIQYIEPISDVIRKQYAEEFK